MPPRTTDGSTTLRELSDTGDTVDGSVNDIRGREVKDKDGVSLGHVKHLLVDDGEGKVRFLVVVEGGLLGIGERRSFIPVDAVTQITDAEVVIDPSHAQVTAAPAYDPAIINEHAYQSSVCGHYGYAPYWGKDYKYPHGRSMSPTLPRKTF